MVKIVIENLGQKELIINDLNKPVLHNLLTNGVDWMHACGGKGRCTTCKMIVLQGENHFTAFTPAEKRYQQQQLLTAPERLACQVRLTGDITIRVPEEYKLPHMKYTS